MKKINIIKTISAKEQFSLRRWFFISFVVLGATLLGIIAISIMQISTWWKLQQQIKQAYPPKTFDVMKQKKDKLQTQYQKMQDTINHLIKLENKKNKVASLLDNITQATNTQVTLEKIKIGKKIKITAQCNTAQDATQFISKLQKTNKFSLLQLASLQRSNTTLQCMIEGTIKK